MLFGYVTSLTSWDFAIDVVRVHVPFVEKLTFGVVEKAVTMVTVDAPVVVLDGSIPLTVEIGCFRVFPAVAEAVLRHKMFFDQVVVRTAVSPLSRSRAPRSSSKWLRRPRCTSGRATSS